MSDEGNFSIQMNLPRDPLHAATAQLLLRALDLALRYDLRPKSGPMQGSQSINARQLVACDLVNWSLGNPMDSSSDTGRPAYGPGSVTDPTSYLERDE